MYGFLMVHGKHTIGAISKTPENLGFSVWTDAQCKCGWDTKIGGFAILYLSETASNCNPEARVQEAWKQAHDEWARKNL